MLSTTSLVSGVWKKSVFQAGVVPLVLMLCLSPCPGGQILPFHPVGKLLSRTVSMLEMVCYPSFDNFFSAFYFNANIFSNVSV